MKKIILTDVDGVILDWRTPFEKFLVSIGYSTIDVDDFFYGIGKKVVIPLVKEFNSCADNLSPLRDSHEILPILAKNYTIIGITSFGVCEFAQKSRIKNLENVFGKIFDYVIFNDVTDSKRSILKEWENRKDVIWIEDKYTNYETGLELGIES